MHRLKKKKKIQKVTIIHVMVLNEVQAEGKIEEAALSEKAAPESYQ